MSFDVGLRLKYTLTVFGLVALACALSLRLIYLYLDNQTKFPINTIKIIATYKHITRAKLEDILSHYQNKSFYTLEVNKLYQEIMQLPWVEEVDISRIRPDTVKISIKEKKAFALWNDSIVATNKTLINDKGSLPYLQHLPKLISKAYNYSEMLKMYAKLQQALTKYGFKIATLEERPNKAWEITLTNGILLRAGKHDTVLRVTRFCKAYPFITESHGKISSVDLRYPKGMAVQ